LNYDLFNAIEVTNVVSTWNIDNLSKDGYLTTNGYATINIEQTVKQTILNLALGSLLFLNVNVKKIGTLYTIPKARCFFIFIGDIVREGLVLKFKQSDDAVFCLVGKNWINLNVVLIQGERY
jgi:hypothetical protein